MVSRRIFLVTCVAISGIQLFRATMAIRTWPAVGRFAAGALRLSIPHGAAYGGAARASFAAVGLLQDGCMLPPAALDAAGDGAPVAVLGPAALANGYYLLPAASAQGGSSDRLAGPAQWTLEAAADGNGTGGWTAVGASAWRLNPQARSAARTGRHSDPARRRHQRATRPSNIDTLHKHTLSPTRRDTRSHAHTYARVRAHRHTHK